MSRAPGGARPSAGSITLVVASAVALGWFLDSFFHRLPFPWGVMPDEGLSILFTQRLLRGEPLYVHDNGFPYLYNNFGPVYYFLLAPLLAALGPHLFVGRCFSLVTTLGSGALAARFASGLGARRAMAWAAGTGAITAADLVPWQLMSRVDTLSALLSCAVLFEAWRLTAPGRAARPLWPLGLLSLVAIFTKQNNVVCVTFAFLALWPVLRWRALRALMWVVAAAATLVAMGHLLTDGAFTYAMSFSLLHLKRAPSKLHLAASYLGNQAGWVVLSSAALALRVPRRRVPVLVWGGLVLGLWQVGEITRVGAGPNYFLYAHFFLVVIGIVAASAVSERGRACQVLAVGIVIGQLGWNAVSLRKYSNWIAPQAYASTRALEGYLRGVDGPVLLDRQPQLWMRSGQWTHYVEVGSLSIDWFHGGAKLEELEEFIAEKRFRAIVLRERTMLPKPVKELVAQNYREHASTALVDDVYHVLVPRVADPSRTR